MSLHVCRRRDVSLTPGSMVERIERVRRRWIGSCLQDMGKVSGKRGVRRLNSAICPGLVSGDGFERVRVNGGGVWVGSQGGRGRGKCIVDSGVWLQYAQA